MSTTNITFHILEDFWKLNPDVELLYPSSFVDDPLSSRLMWATALIYHSDSPYAFYNQSTRKKIVEDSYLTFPYDPPEFVVPIFKEYLMTRVQRSLVDWRNKLEERDQFIESVKYDVSTFEMLDKMLKEKERLWNSLLQAELKNEEDKNKGQTLGGAEESLSEKGLI